MEYAHLIVDEEILRKIGLAEVERHFQRYCTRCEKRESEKDLRKLLSSQSRKLAFWAEALLEFHGHDEQCPSTPRPSFRPPHGVAYREALECTAAAARIFEAPPNKTDS